MNVAPHTATSVSFCIALAFKLCSRSYFRKRVFISVLSSRSLCFVAMADKANEQGEQFLHAHEHPFSLKAARQSLASSSRPSFLTAHLACHFPRSFSRVCLRLCLRECVCVCTACHLSSVRSRSRPEGGKDIRLARTPVQQPLKRFSSRRGQLAKAGCPKLNSCCHERTRRPLRVSLCSLALVGSCTHHCCPHGRL